MTARHFDAHISGESGNAEIYDCDDEHLSTVLSVSFPGELALQPEERKKEAAWLALRAFGFVRLKIGEGEPARPRSAAP